MLLEFICLRKSPFHLRVPLTFFESLIIKSWLKPGVGEVRRGASIPIKMIHRLTEN